MAKDALTLDDIGARIVSLERLITEEVRQGRAFEAVVMVMLARFGDLERVTVKEAAALEERLYGKGSMGTVRSKIAAGVYTLEKKDGEKQARIPVEQIVGGYLPIDRWRKRLAILQNEVRR